VSKGHRAQSAKALRELVEEAHRDHPSIHRPTPPRTTGKLVTAVERARQALKAD
jgi:hypothetical protein